MEVGHVTWMKYDIKNSLIRNYDRETSCNWGDDLSMNIILKWIIGK
jgi:hypothetical protein